MPVSTRVPPHPGATPRLDERETVVHASVAAKLSIQACRCATFPEPSHSTVVSGGQVPITGASSSSSWTTTSSAHVPPKGSDTVSVRTHDTSHPGGSVTVGSGTFALGVNTVPGHELAHSYVSGSSSGSLATPASATSPHATVTSAPALQPGSSLHSVPDGNARTVTVAVSSTTPPSSSATRRRST